MKKSSNNVDFLFECVMERKSFVCLLCNALVAKIVGHFKTMVVYKRYMLMLFILMAIKKPGIRNKMFLWGRKWNEQAGSDHERRSEWTSAISVWGQLFKGLPLWNCIQVCNVVKWKDLSATELGIINKIKFNQINKCITGEIKRRVKICLLSDKLQISRRKTI